MEPEKQFREFRLADSGGDLTKRWFVVGYVWSEEKEKLIRKRIEVTGSTVKARLSAAKKLCEELNTQLRSGAVVDPKPKPKPLFHAEMPIPEAIDYFLMHQAEILVAKRFCAKAIC
ncbi:hypothetical protein [Tellurirhabdus bombi]|uniref:hypothetical protein n=1 Tax=Tellurirhabdus bombi TaxID=2907205 RepID=UPI001F28CB24|nr:hypothetical protein [Tellurirhabdus bombi]